MKAWSVYILRCGSLYTGVAIDVRARLDRHRCGKGARYTRSRLPVRLVYQQRVRDRSTALKREIEIKSMTRAEKLGLIGRTRRP